MAIGKQFLTNGRDRAWGARTLTWHAGLHEAENIAAAGVSLTRSA
jgi:hypothetical protein